jgi:pimeloyl-ACP methyl ester carboxylesterase
MVTTSVSGVRVHYDDRGEGEGAPLVFIHGAWSDAESWQPQIDRFGDERRVISYDIRGHGQTGASDRRRYSVDLFAEDLDALLDDLGVDRAVVCGLSLGSMIAQSYLASHPERVEGIVLAGAVQTFPPVSIPPMLKSLTSPIVPLGVSLATTGTRPTFEALLGSIRSVTGGPWLSRDADTRRTALESVERTSSEEFKKVFRALYRFEPPALDGVSVPALIVYGEHEAPPVKRQSDDLARTLGGRAVRVAGAGHLVNQDNPEAFNATLARFLSELDAGTGS